MIIVLGSIVVKAGCLEAAAAESLAHVRRSRMEPGCISHDVAQDSENPLRLMFTERWTDDAALRVHFSVAASRGFVKALRDLVSAPPEMEIFDAVPLNL